MTAQLDRVRLSRAAASLLPDLRALLRRAQARASTRRTPILASLTRPVDEVDPLTFFARAGHRTLDRTYWCQPAEGFALAGAGAAYEIAPTGRGRFAAAGAAWQALRDGALLDRPAETGVGAGPLLLGGFAFDPERPPTGLWRGFPDARLILPRLMLTRNRTGSYLTLNTVVQPDHSDHEAASEAERLAAEWAELAGEGSPSRTEPPARTEPLPIRGEGGRIVKAPSVGRSFPPPFSGEGRGVGSPWLAKVATAAQAIRDGALEKVVLARSVTLDSASEFDITSALAWLAETYPTCYCFAFGRGGRTFLGATPERLVRLEDGAVRATCLAGSRRRGTTAEEDARLGAELLGSAKDRQEHAVVVRVLTEGLAELCDDLTVPAEPALLSVANVHHLYTPVTARLRPGSTLLDAVERLHPTPAVGGFPREAALRYIREHEGLDRGWYAGPVGWFDGRDGEFAVALRSALVEGSRATLFAGCGIMGDSDPEQEYAESSVKLRPMCAALGEAGQGR